MTSSKGLMCSICTVSFSTIQEQRHHAKSDSHVENLKSRAVASGSMALPTTDNYRHGKADSADTSSPSDTDTEDAPGEQTPEFDPQQCIFCPHSSDTFDQSLAHMKTAHGLTIPYAKHLVVEPDTLVWYLHLVIFAYRECISCGTRRRTVEGVQQHMADKGHCRFSMSDEMMDFYDLEGITGYDTANLVRPDEDSLRLPSGSIISHRHQTPLTKPRLLDTSEPSPSDDKRPLPSQASPDALIARDAADTTLATQLARLRVGDQQSLMHLPDYRQRSVLAQRKKEFNAGQRAGRRMQIRQDRMENLMLMKRFRHQHPERLIF